jgi:hypothetical protein
MDLTDVQWAVLEPTFARAVARMGAAGYDSDGLDDLLMTQYGIVMIAANRRGRAKTQDGRPLRRAKRRWKIELQLACGRILLRAFMRSLLGPSRRDADPENRADPAPDSSPQPTIANTLLSR